MIRALRAVLPVLAAGLLPALAGGARAFDGAGEGGPGAPGADGPLKPLAGAALEKAVEAIAGYDEDGDGKLSPKEFPLAELFADFDLDGDGFISREELRRLLAPADAGEPDAPEPPPPPKGEPGGKGPPGKGPGDRPRDGKDRPKDAPPPPGPPQGDPEPVRMDAARAREIMETDPRWNPEARRETILRGFDRDPKDGKVQRKEYPGGEADSIFRKFDRDRNDELDRRELLALAKEQVADLEKSRSRPNRGNFHYLFDLDNDRRVTREEYALLRGPASAFRQYDADRDGVVGYDEVRYPERYAGRGSREAAAATPENRSVWDLHDKNGDRRVSLEEFGGSESVFRRLDRNGDGWLTLADG